MKRVIIRILFGLAGLLLALVVFLVGSVMVDGLLGGDRLAAVSNVGLPNPGGPEVRAYVARPQGAGPHPAVIMIHEFWGLNQSIVDKAEFLASEGYVVIAPDTFRGSTTGWIPRAIWQVISHPAEQVNTDLDAVYTWLEAQPEVDAQRIAIMGFCYGGGTSLRYSLHNDRLRATAIFYGSLVTDPQALRALPGPVLGIFGGADSSIPQSEVEAFEAGLTQVGVEHQITVYDGQPHAFVSSVAGIQAGGAQGQAWAELLEFLRANLQAEGSGRHGAASAWAAAPIPLDYLLKLAFLHAAPGHGH